MHKSRHTPESGRFFENHSVTGIVPFPRFAWFRRVSDSIGPDILSKLSDSQKRCSGIEYILDLIEDVTSHSSSSSRQAYVNEFRQQILKSPVFAWVKHLDLDHLESSLNLASSTESAADIARKALLQSFIEHAEFLDLFSPHLVRVPRDIDGRLIPNKDAGCSPPCDFGTSRLPKSARDTCKTELSENGLVLIRNVVDESEIASVRDSLRIKTSYSPNSKSFETRETSPETMFEGDRSQDVSYTQLASGRFSYQLRCSKLEPLVTQIHRSVMPVVWDHLYSQRSDSFLNQLTGESSPNPASNRRVFLSSVSLVCADPLAGKDSWHANNGAGGVVVIVPLTPYEEKTGSLVILPGSHKSWSWPRGILEAIHTCLIRGGPTEPPADVGDILVLDSRTMRKHLPNEKFNKSKVFLSFHYDFSDKPAPSQWLTTTLAQNAIACSIEKMSTQIYPRIP